MSKKRRKKFNISAEQSAAPVKAAKTKRKSAAFDPDYTHVIKDLKRIGILAGSFIVLLVILSFILN